MTDQTLTLDMLNRLPVGARVTLDGYVIEKESAEDWWPILPTDTRGGYVLPVDLIGSTLVADTAAPGSTLTAGDLIARLSLLDPATPVIVPTADYYANVIGVTPNGPEAYAAVIEWRDDYDSRQF